MSQVSLNRLKDGIANRLIDLLLEVISATNKSSGELLFTHHFLSSTEQMMLAKRVGIAILLKRGYTYDLIMEYLKVSRPTVAKVSEILSTSDSHTQRVLEDIIKRKQIHETLSKFEYYLERIIPPRGRDWSVWRSNLEKDKRESERPF